MDSPYRVSIAVKEFGIVGLNENWFAFSTLEEAKEFLADLQQKINSEKTCQIVKLSIRGFDDSK